MDDPIVERLVAESESKIADIGSQIEHLQSLLTKEYNKLAELKYSTIPIHVLPMEILSEIFSISIVPIRPDGVLSDNHDVSLYLSHVCRYWRQVALGTPRLWTQLYIPILECPTAAYIDGIKTWLGRSMQLPLSIKISAGVC
ncbi:hypothetical protein B0H11DRAFT_1235787 [Mycena galericulata]|nr:hypothetical protein B0H11DRAFT_1235787 [Mycena galericulata]